MADTIKIEGWLPIFPGFYDTIFAFDDDYVGSEEETRQLLYQTDQDKEFEKVNKDVDELLRDNYWSYFDYKEYEKDVAKACVDYINDKLMEEPEGPQINFIFEKVSSPKEYNFINDSIDCQLEFKMSAFEKVVDYLNKHNDDFAKDIEERFTSRSGFISFYSNDSQDWLDEFDNFIDNAEITKDLVFKVSYAVEWYLLHSNKEEVYRGYGDNLLEVEMYEYLSDHDIHSSNYFLEKDAIEEVNEAFGLNITSLTQLIEDAEELEEIIKIKNPDQIEMFD